MNALLELASAAGLAHHWRDYRGETREVTPDTLRFVLHALGYPCASDQQLTASLAQAKDEARQTQPQAEEQVACIGVQDIAAGRRLWGLTTQLYSLRRPGDGGIGDFTSLARFARLTAAEGASCIGVSPVHALFSADVHHHSPYAPSSRLFYNALHADPVDAIGADQVRALISTQQLDADLTLGEASELINWPSAAATRLRLLRAAFAVLPEAAQARLRAFRLERGTALEDHARFEALHAQEFAQQRWHWRDWPAALRDARSAAVTEFADTHTKEIDFHIFLQWLAEAGLAKAQSAAREAGMAIGLIADLAVGADSGGSGSWSKPGDMLASLTLGAPPDLINQQGQNWGLTTFSPRALRAQAMKPFTQILRSALRHTGGVRIDHVMGLQRLWVIPEGASSNEGVYLNYPLQAMLQQVALESRRHGAIIIGEDLGTVPMDFYKHLGRAGIMGMRVLWFERDHGYFIEPARWPDQAIATTTTHDLPSVAGWWSGRDIYHRFRANQCSDEAQELRERAEDRRTLWAAFQHAGVGEGPMPAQAGRAINAAIRYVARTPAPLALVPIEDVAGLIEQPNLPGTTTEHPNWRRRLPGTADELLGQTDARERLAHLRSERP